MFDFNLIAVVEEESYYRWKYRECTIANYDYGIEKKRSETRNQLYVPLGSRKRIWLIFKIM